ncbi:hypothetical protein Pta02_35140 [Planobispora takensis]|uniref:Uncharacterized protein n=1 Tax=Planobispora takensis TaxID=1367882 RepID=A0A8J3SXF6_9ACTN|nr:hypothetical protein Pta02_35140 [Planobispora takensis]
MTDGENGIPGVAGAVEPMLLPRREDAPRCAHQSARRRCVLPPGHTLEHVYPHQAVNGAVNGVRAAAARHSSAPQATA